MATDEEYALAVRGWKQAVGVIEAQQKALDWMSDLLGIWKDEGRLPTNDEDLARQHYEVFERARRVGSDYVNAMRQSGAI